PTSGDEWDIELLCEIREALFGRGDRADEQYETVIANTLLNECGRGIHQLFGFLKIDDLNTATVCEHKRTHLRVRLALFTTIKNTRFHQFAGSFRRISGRLGVLGLCYCLFGHRRKYSK